MSQGLRGEQVALYTKDMYIAEREAYEEEAVVYPEVYKVMKGAEVKGAGDKSTQILGAGDLTRHTVEGQDINFKSPIEGWSFYTKYHTFSDGIALSKEAVEDTVKLGNLLKDLASSWGLSERYLKETIAARPFNQGGATAGDWVFNGSHTGQTDPQGDLAYDGKPLFNLTGNTRSTKGGGTYYNAVSSLTVTPSDFETLYNLMTKTNNRDERDRVMKNTVDTALTEPGADAFAMKRIINTTGENRSMPGTQLNDMNPYYGLIKKHIMWDYLTDGAFYLGKAQHRDFQWHERQMKEIRFYRHESNLGYRASINCRFGIMIKNWRAWGRGGGTYS